MSCVSMLQMMGANPANLIEAGGNLQAGAGLVQSISSLASGAAASRIAASDAAIERTAGASRAGAIRRAADQEAGSARAAAAASGVKVGSSSVMQAEGDIARYSEQDAISAILTGENRAAASLSQGRNARTAAFNGAAESLLEGGAAWRRTRRVKSFRPDDPYRNPGYVGGSEGE